MVTLAIQIANNVVTFQVFSLITVEMPVQTTNKTNYDEHTKLIKTPYFLAISNSGSHAFISRPLVCISTLHYQHVSAEELCEFKYSTKPISKTIIYHTHKATFLMSTMQEKFQLFCEGKSPESHKACTFCLIETPCKCPSLIDNKRIQQSFMNCNPAQVTINTKHTANLMTLNAFNLTSDKYNSSTDTFKYTQHSQFYQEYKSSR
jgi:hypothetical protein